MRDRLSPTLLQLQSDVLKAVALGYPLTEVADRLCRRAEELAEGNVCSILLVDDEGRLRPLAGPSLPDAYSAAIDGLLIGPQVGSCGTAAFRCQEVVVTDISSDPLWADFRDVALGFGLAACWSSPVVGPDGRTIATFAFYWRSRRGPDELERRIVETCVDLLSIAIRHESARAEISRLAYVDRLTGLPNRASFEAFATAALAGRPEGRTVGIHYLDLDDFKTVNDTLGHRVGDLFLAAVAERLRGAMPTGALIARLGGDEFGICAESETVEDQLAFAETLLAALRRPITLDGHGLTAAASVGIALAPMHGVELVRLSQRADTALYAAKQAGRRTVRLFSDEMARAVEERALLKADLAAAVACEQLHLVYQPIVDLQTGEVVRFEALLRWTHLLHGAIPPDRFVPLAEETGAIAEIGAFVLARALADAATWPPAVGLAVNVSPVQLRDRRFSARLATALADSGTPPRRLVVEVTETSLLERDGTGVKTLDDIRLLGVGIALDDFGTGYSSLSLIRDRRFDRLKIDRSFVEGLGVDAGCDTIVRSTLAIARETGLHTTAEGIETPEQRDWLVAHGCREGQGYLISRPMPASHVAAYLGDQPKRRRA